MGEIADELTGEYDAAPGEILADTCELVRELAAEGLLSA